MTSDKKPQVILIKIGAAWCQPCKALDQILNVMIKEAHSKFPGEYRSLVLTSMLSFDTDLDHGTIDTMRLSDEHGVIPVLLLVRPKLGGFDIIRRMDGAGVTRGDIRKFIGSSDGNEKS